MQVVTRLNVRTLSEVRLVGETSNEIVSAVSALEKAEAEGLDLVVVSDKSSPPVVRIQDFKKIQYEEKKSKAKHQRKTDVKEVQFRANISEHDFQTKVNAISRFLERGDKVKVIVRLKGREREAPERAHLILEKVGKSIKDAKMSRVPGPIAIAIIEPSK